MFAAHPSLHQVVYAAVWYVVLPIVLLRIGRYYASLVENLSDDFPKKRGLTAGLKWMWLYLLLIRAPMFLTLALGWELSIGVKLVYVLGVFITLMYFQDEGTEIVAFNIEHGEQLAEKYRQKIAILETRQRFQAERALLGRVGLVAYGAAVVDFVFATLVFA